MKHPPSSAKTLGEKLKPPTLDAPFRFRLIATLTILAGLGAWALTENAQFGVGVATISFLIPLFSHLANRGGTQKPNFLIRNDKQWFMASLKLTDKTAIFDGSNIYHFGIDNKIGALPLGALVSALRSEGYRIVCFFDANIYFTLRDNHAFKHDGRRFSINILQNVFDLKPDEIYVVPKGIQADKFVLESISHLPISFAVTNDRFRDYEKAYGFLAADNQWRKGVKIQGRQLKLYQHKFKYPLNVK